MRQKMRKQQSRLVLDFGLAVRRARTTVGLSQQDLAKKAGVTFAHIGRMERGELSPRLDTCDRIAHALGMSLLQLLSAEPPRDTIKELKVVASRNAEKAIQKGPRHAVQALSVIAKMIADTPHRSS